MYEFTVNGQKVQTKREEKLLSFLREELDLTSVKNGCAEGACGACTILVDGKAVRACVLSTAKAAGKSIVTCEGLSEREKAVYGYAFTRSGAVQCGFCTPGMVMSAKGLLDVNPSANRTEVKKALRGNLCRCTGYKKIVDAVIMAAKMFREQTPVPSGHGSGFIGESMQRVDAPGKVIGIAEYVDDMRIPGLIFGSAVRSEYPRARIHYIDTLAAKQVPGVVCVLTAADIPGKLKIGHLKKDYDVMIPLGRITHFCGDAVALVAAETKEALEKAKTLIKVEYEPLTPVLSLQHAMMENAPDVHESCPSNLLSEVIMKRGDAATKIAMSPHVVTRHYSTGPSEHAFLEPESAVALPDGDGVIIYSADQGIYQTRAECAELLDLPLDKVRVIAKMVGGGFGGKEDMSVQHHAALLAYKTQRAVKVTLTRDESILIHPKRHGFEIDITTACDENGILTGMQARLFTDSGAYASLGGPVLQRACTHAAGPFNFQDVDIIGRAYYTNNPPAGAFRGFGVPQSCFAIECNLNLLAEAVGISAWEIRRRNAIKPGDVLPNGQYADDSTAFIETLDAVKPYYDSHPDCGIACAMKNSGLGVGVPDIGRTRLQIINGKVFIYSSAACIGQGLGTILTQIVRETTGLPLEQIVYQIPDTGLAPNAGMTTASRQTLFTGEATRRAALALKETLCDKDLSVLEGQEFYGEYEGITDPMGSEKPNPVSHVAYGYATHLVELNEDGTVKLVLAAHDVGRAINPTNIEGQVEGGVTMSLGWALTERFKLKDGRPLARFGTLGLMRTDQVPDIQTVIVEKNASELACGAKGIGEICSIPTAPAVQNAYYNRDQMFRTTLPLTDTPYMKK